MTMPAVADPFEIKMSGEEVQVQEQPEIEVSVPGAQAAAAPPQPTTGAVVTTPASSSSSSPAKASDPIPRFEGAQVMLTQTKLAGTHTLDGEESLVLTMDDRVRLIGEYRVLKVTFETNSNGDLVRVQTLKAMEVERCPYNPADVNDDGVWRARPVQP